MFTPAPATEVPIPAANKDAAAPNVIAVAAAAAIVKTPPVIATVVPAACAFLQSLYTWSSLSAASRRLLAVSFFLEIIFFTCS